MVESNELLAMAKRMESYNRVSKIFLLGVRNL